MAAEGSFRKIFQRLILWRPLRKTIASIAVKVYIQNP